jgi:RNA polymerase sigma factor (sigma-70 family)
VVFFFLPRETRNRGREIAVADRSAEISVAKGLGSSNEEERMRAVADFVRPFTATAPTELAMLATRYPDVCKSYRGDPPLPQYLLERLPVPPEKSLAWRIACLKGDELSKALREFEETYGEQLRNLLARYCRDPADVYQNIMTRLWENQGFRQTFFGKFSGTGGLFSYITTVFIREACRASKAQKQDQGSDLLEDAWQETEDAPSQSALRKELHEKMVAVLAEVSDDPAFMPFLLQQEDMTYADVLRILKTPGLNENTLRQRILRFRERFQEVWRRLYPDDPCPFA